MAEINIDRKRQRSICPIVLALIVVAAVVFGVWYYLDGGSVALSTLPLESPVGSS